MGVGGVSSKRVRERGGRAATGRRIGDDARGGRSRSAMFSVSSFVPVRANDDECEYEYGESDDDASTSFAVEAKRVYGDESPGTLSPAPLAIPPRIGYLASFRRATRTRRRTRTTIVTIGPRTDSRRR